MKKYLVEFIGTFFLVVVVAMSGNPIAIGAVLAAMVYMGGYISGAHYNPAVTLAVLMRRKIDGGTAMRYIGVQLLGGLVAAIIVYIVRGTSFSPHPSADFFVAFLVEIIFTFALASVVLHVATSPETSGNNYFGLAIGLVLMAGAFSGGGISGGVYNPAVGVGPLLVDGNFPGNLQYIVLYILGPAVGAVLAASAYNYLSSDTPPLEETDETVV